MPKYCKDENVFLFTKDFGSKQLKDIMQICNWKNNRLASILSVSPASINNYLGNASMTNSNPSTVSEPQFITLLLYIQKKIEEQDSLAVAFAAFAILCPGISAYNIDKLCVLAQNEAMEIPKEQICSLYATLFPYAIRNINILVDWQCNGKEKTLCEYKGINHVTELYTKEPATDEDKKLAMKNAKKIIPLYLKMFMSDKPV